MNIEQLWEKLGLTVEQTTEEEEPETPTLQSGSLGPDQEGAGDKDPLLSSLKRKLGWGEPIR